ncbi:beta-lactamase family protein [Aquimarina sp. ERC-38]|uniref:beta-lactamase family protein n=1 Tax=Aquimarina sp. ERC-38 TaxID=2949996 RepID=UPI0022465981|nr:beta-lactamase family protein [Aquimarina sp. ERC-38]UZO79489.1 beta-lactamase family protein [Aquimarina sp. ERC-38]
MKYILVFVLALVVNFSFSQTEKSKNKKVTEEFIKYYNANNYENIFSMFADVMKNASPINETTEFLKGLKAQAGKITNQEFLKYKNGTLASYKTTFENAVMVLNISIDHTSKINGLLVEPFGEPINTENVINNLTYENSVLTKEQADLIFEKTKMFPNHTQVSVAIIRDGKVDYYGMHKKKDTISNIDNHQSIFEIGSISKVFTSTLLANFVIAKKLKLNEPINSYLETTFNNNTVISFVDLANHTSGLPRLPDNLDLTKVNPENPYRDYREKELTTYLTTYLTLSNKGKHQYSNLGAGLLGYTLSKIGNDSYENLLQKKIFSKYNMQNSTADISKVKGDLVKSLYKKGKVIPNWEFSVLAGAGAIFSSVEDLSRFVVSQFDPTNEELALTRTKTFEISNTTGIGLGWHILKSKSDHLWYWHNGGTGGYFSSMVINTSLKTGIILLSNVSPSHPNAENIDKLNSELMKTLEN